MQNENGLHFSDYEFSTEEKSPSLNRTQDNYFNPYNSVLEINLKTKSKRIKKQNTSNKKQTMGDASRLKNWNKEQQLEYFCAVIKFSIINPYHRLSWGEWKKNRFYNFVSEHFVSIYGQSGAKTAKQCKTKDQNFKKRYYITEEPIDMLELSEKIIGEELNNMMGNGMSCGVNDKKRMERYEKVMKELDQFEQNKSKIKGYEEQLLQLVSYNKEAKCHMEHLITSIT